MNPRTASEYLHQWFPDTRLHREHPGDIITFHFGAASQVVGILKLMLLAEINLWPVCEQPDAQDWGAFLNPTLMSRTQQPTAIGVIFPTEKGFSVKVAVLGERDPVPQIEPTLPADVATLGPFAIGMPDFDESAPDPAALALTERIREQAGAQGAEEVFVVTSVGGNGTLDKVLGCETRVVHESLTYGPARNTVAIVAIPALIPATV